MKSYTQRGFSLIELLVVMVLVVVMAAVVMTRFFSSSTDSKLALGGEKIIADLSGRIYERRADAGRMNGSVRKTAFDLIAPPIEFDLKRPETTRTIITEGVDENGDGRDDTTGDELSILLAETKTASVGDWRLRYRGESFQTESGWQLVETADDLGKIPLIAGGARGRGIPVTRIGFDKDGRALHRSDSGVWEKTPDGTRAGKKSNESAFWAFYFVNKKTYNSAVAVAVYPASGIVERFRFNGTDWQGFGNRIITGK